MNCYFYASRTNNKIGQRIFLCFFCKSFSGLNEHVEQNFHKRVSAVWRCKSYSLWRNKRLRKWSIYWKRRGNKFLFWKPRQMFFDIRKTLQFFSNELINFLPTCFLGFFDERFTRNFFFLFLVSRSITRFLRADDIATLEGVQIDNLSLISLQLWSRAQFTANENKRVYFWSTPD